MWQGMSYEGALVLLVQIANVGLDRAIYRVHISITRPQGRRARSH